jgi:hypothetical protein
MKLISIFLFIFFSGQFFAANVILPRLDYSLFAPEGKTDFENLFSQDKKAIKSTVFYLFEKGIASQSGSKAYDLKADYEKFWKVHSENFHLIDLNQDSIQELIYSGTIGDAEDKESFMIYVQYGEVWKEVYNEDGHLAAYSVHPNTGEILLYHHRYPCCSQYTHSVNRLRFLNNRVYKKEKYFIASDRGMMGTIFPEKVFYPQDYHQLKEDKVLRWSSEAIKMNAFYASNTSDVIGFAQGSYYKILARKAKSMYVIFYSPPKIEESRMVNPNNLQNSQVMCWID